MSYFIGVPDLVEPKAPPADGPSPIIVEFASIDQEISFIAKQARILARTQNVAILFRDRQDEKLLQRYLPRERIRLHRDMRAWQSEPGIRYGTYHSAKGGSSRYFMVKIGFKEIFISKIIRFKAWNPYGIIICSFY